MGIPEKNPYKPNNDLEYDINHNRFLLSSNVIVISSIFDRLILSEFSFIDFSVYYIAKIVVFSTLSLLLFIYEW